MDHHGAHTTPKVAQSKSTLWKSSQGPGLPVPRVCDPRAAAHKTGYESVRGAKVARCGAAEGHSTSTICCAASRTAQERQDHGGGVH